MSRPRARALPVAASVKELFWARSRECSGSGCQARWRRPDQVSRRSESYRAREGVREVVANRQLQKRRERRHRLNVVHALDVDGRPPARHRVWDDPGGCLLHLKLGLAFILIQYLSLSAYNIRYYLSKTLLMTLQLLTSLIWLCFFFALSCTRK